MTEVNGIKLSDEAIERISMIQDDVTYDIEMLHKLQKKIVRDIDDHFSPEELKFWMNYLMSLEELFEMLNPKEKEDGRDNRNI